MEYEKKKGDQNVQDSDVNGLSWQKEYLTTAPYIIVMFKQVSDFSFFLS